MDYVTPAFRLDRRRGGAEDDGRAGHVRRRRRRRTADGRHRAVGRGGARERRQVGRRRAPRRADRADDGSGLDGPAHAHRRHRRARRGHRARARRFRSSFPRARTRWKCGWRPACSPRSCHGAHRRRGQGRQARDACRGRSKRRASRRSAPARGGASASEDLPAVRGRPHDGGGREFPKMAATPPCRHSLFALFPFLAWRDRVTRATLRADLLAGLVGALVVLPQARRLRDARGAAAAIRPLLRDAARRSSPRCGARRGTRSRVPPIRSRSSVFATVAPLAAPGSADYIELVLTLTLLVGLVQIAMGLARLGALVNFISHTVVVGFTAGAGLLIIAAQLAEFLRRAGRRRARGSSRACARSSRYAAIGGSVDRRRRARLRSSPRSPPKRWLPRIPYMIVGHGRGQRCSPTCSLAPAWPCVPTVGALPSALPAVVAAVIRSRRMAQARAGGARADGARARPGGVGRARRRARNRGSGIDGNQEFIGQGLSNLAGAFTSAYPSSGSFNRIWVNYDAGARTPLAAVFSARRPAASSSLAIAPLAALPPAASMAALLFVVAWGLIDVNEMRKIAGTQPRRGAGSRVHVRLDAGAPARVRDLRRRAGVAVRLSQPHDASPPHRGDAGPGVAASPVQRSNGE